MSSANVQLFLPLIFFFFFFFFLFLLTPLHALGQQTIPNGFGRRVLLSFKEKTKGSNATFDCSPSGRCVPCLYSEKDDEKYHCSETGYRIPFKCVEIKDVVKDSKKTNSQNVQSSTENSDTSGKQRGLLDDSSTSDGKSQSYITYRSCIPPPAEEKLSVLSFEGIVIFLLIISGSVIYMKKKSAVSVSGYAAVGRVQTNSRF